MDWDDFFKNENSLRPIIRAVNRSVPNDSNDAQEALSYVLEQMRKNNYKHLQSYDGKQDVNHFLFIVARRIMRDYWVHKRGRLLYPDSLLADKVEKAPQLYNILLLVYKMLCYQQLPEDYIIESLVDFGKDRKMVKDAIEYILIHYDHREYWKNRKFLKSRAHPGDALGSETPDAGWGPDDLSSPIEQSPEMEMKGQKLFYVFNYILRGEPEQIPASCLLPDNMLVFMKAARRKFKASDLECKFLRLKDLDGMTVAAAGRQVGWNRYVAFRRYRHLFQEFKELFQKEIKEIKEILDELNPDLVN